MFARVSTYQGPPELIDQGVSHARERILPAVRQIDGFSGVLFLVDRESGKALSVTLWESERAMRASEEEANRLRRESAEAGGETIEAVESYEVSILEVRLAGGEQEKGLIDEARNRLRGR